MSFILSIATRFFSSRLYNFDFQVVTKNFVRREVQLKGELQLLLLLSSLFRCSCYLPSIDTLKHSKSKLQRHTSCYMHVDAITTTASVALYPSRFLSAFLWNGDTYEEMKVKSESYHLNMDGMKESTGSTEDSLTLSLSLQGNCYMHDTYREVQSMKS